MIRTFIAKDPHHCISHPALKEAAGNDSIFTVQFTPADGDSKLGVFETDNTRVADVLETLIERGNITDVKEITANVAPTSDFTERTPIGTAGLPPADQTSNPPVEPATDQPTGPVARKNSRAAAAPAEAPADQTSNPPGEPAGEQKAPTETTGA
jgi:hypothetical protein